MTEYPGDSVPRVDLTKPRQVVASPNSPISPPPPAPTGAGPSPGPSRPRRGLLLIAGLLALVLIGGIAGAIVLTRDEEASTSTSDARGTTHEAPSSQGEGDPQAEPSSPADADAGGEGEPTQPSDPDGDALNQLTSIAATDQAASGELDGVWTAQLASSAADESPVDVLAKYQDLNSRYPDALLVWSGDWPGSFGPSSLQSWVVVSGERYATTRPLLEWCASEGWSDGQCWAKRLARTGDDPLVNTDRAPADDRNN